MKCLNQHNDDENSERIEQEWIAEPTKDEQKFQKTVTRKQVTKFEEIYEGQKLNTNVDSFFALNSWILGFGIIWKFGILLTNFQPLCVILLYVFTLLFVGLPLMYMEVGLGQFSSRDGISVWSMCPVFRGIGYSSVYICFSMLLYHHRLNAYILEYVYYTLTETPPWFSCDFAKDYKNVNATCYVLADNETVRAQCATEEGIENCTDSHKNWMDSAHFFWIYKINGGPVSSPTQFGHLLINSLISSLVVSLSIFIFNCRGYKSLKKVTKFSIIFPVLVMLLLMIVSFFEEGVSHGLRMFFKIDLSDLQKPQLWQIVLDVVMFTLGIGLGGLFNIGSLNNFRAPFHLTLILTVIFIITISVCYGILMFNSFGIISYELNVPLTSIVKLPNTVLFGKFSNILYFLGGFPHFWTTLFYLSIFFMNARAEAYMVFNIWYSLLNVIPKFKRYPLIGLIGFHLFVYLTTILLCTQQGSFILEYMDTIISGSELLFLVVIEMTAIVIFYGIQRFIDDMHFMLGFRASYYWQVCWFLAPVYLTIMFCFVVKNIIVSEHRITADHLKFLWLHLPLWIHFCVISILILTFAIITSQHMKRDNKPWYRAFTPTLGWGPKDTLLNRSRDMFSAHSMTKEYMYRQNKLKSRYKEYYINLIEIENY